MSSKVNNDYSLPYIFYEEVVHTIILFSLYPQIK